MNAKQVCELARALPEVSVKDHFGSDGFSAHQRMFLTVWHADNRANLRLSLGEQHRFLSVDGDAFTPIDNAWGRQGWTSVQLEFVDKEDFQLALASAWEYSKTKTARATTSKRKPAAKKKPARKAK